MGIIQQLHNFNIFHGKIEVLRKIFPTRNTSRNNLVVKGNSNVTESPPTPPIAWGAEPSLKGASTPSDFGIKNGF